MAMQLQKQCLGMISETKKFQFLTKCERCGWLYI